MRVRSTVLCFSILCLSGGVRANDAVDRAHKFEDAGDFTSARQAWAKSLQSAPNDPELAAGYAQFLERYRDPAARDAWLKSAALWKTAGRTPDALHSARQAVMLDLIAGDRTAAEADSKTYRDLGAADFALPQSS